MGFNLDKITDRGNTNSVKWNFNKEMLGVEDVLPMWVADMDFPVPEAVTKAIIKRAEHPIYGYSSPDDRYYNAIINWMKRRHDWDIKREWIVFTPGIVPAINWMIQTYSKPGDKIILQQPVYYPFANAVKNNGREIINNPLKYVDGQYYMDFEDLEKKIDSRVRMLILCSPHNPVGRVWTSEELQRLGEICIKNNILIVSDEIHSDLIYKGHKHTPFASISDEFQQNCIVCNAPSKTFNIAGLQASNIIIPNNKLREKFIITLENNSIMAPNTFAIVALQAAYDEGEEWLDNVVDYIQDNFAYLNKFIQERMPGVKVVKPEGTYLVWMDFRYLGMNTAELKDFMLNKAKVGFDEGYIFGPGGEGFERINIACPRGILKEGLERIEKAIGKH